MDVALKLWFVGLPLSNEEAWSYATLVLWTSKQPYRLAFARGEREGAESVRAKAAISFRCTSAEAKRYHPDQGVLESRYTWDHAYSLYKYNKCFSHFPMKSL